MRYLKPAEAINKKHLDLVWYTVKINISFINHCCGYSEIKQRASTYPYFTNGNMSCVTMLGHITFRYKNFYLLQIHCIRSNTFKFQYCEVAGNKMSKLETIGAMFLKVSWIAKNVQDNPLKITTWTQLTSSSPDIRQAMYTAL